MSSTQTDNQSSVFVNDIDNYGQQITSVVKPEINIGLDTNGEFYSSIVAAGENGQLDISKLDSFTHISQAREQIYQLLDTMAEDPIISAVLETYAEDATEHNDNGRIIWCESKDPEIAKYITFLLDSINVDKHSYQWVHSLCKYGDLYLHLFRDSDMEDGLFAAETQDKPARSRSSLQEDVNVFVYPDSDKYVHYIEDEPNPAQMFELMKFGKSYAYIKAETDVLHVQNDYPAYTNQYNYQFNRKDVNVYDARTYVHAALEDNSSRVPETVDIFTTDSVDGSQTSKLSYKVRRGQSLLYNTFKIWRQMMLLEASLLLNRLTKSSIVRVIGVEVGDMDKNDVGPKLRSIKSLIENKTAINQSQNITEYTNPGPMENNIYVPTKNGIGAITTQQIGGDVDVKGLADIDYFRQKLFGSLKVPAQYFGFTDDSTGFNGGTSLSIISSRYAKMVKRIQNTYIQAITDAINLMLLDKGLQSYINNFELHMVTPTTQEEIDRRDNTASKVQIAGDVMNLLSDVESVPVRLQILQSLLSDIVTDAEVLDIINEYTADLEGGGTEHTTEEEDTEADEFSPRHQSPMIGMVSPERSDEAETEMSAQEEPLEAPEQQILPTPNQLNAGDFTDNDIEF